MTVEADDFKDFLEKYRNQFSDEVTEIIIDYNDLKDWNPKIAKLVLDKPDIYLAIIKQSTQNFTDRNVDVLIKNVDRKIELRDLRAKHLSKLISVNGIVSRVSPIRPMIYKAVFECRKCGETNTIVQNEPYLVTPHKCITKKCRSRQFRLIEDPTQTTYFNVQELAIQEKPEDLDSGQTPQLVNLEITKDSIIGKINAGDVVDIVGIMRTKPPSPTSKKRKWDIYVDVLCADRTNKDPSDINVSEEEELEIRELAFDPDVYKKLTASIAPSIYGYDHIKEAIVYQLFGGCETQYPDRTVRGNIHVLWIDDPSKAKSQILMAAKNLAARGLYVTGGGATGAGLTAAVIKVEDGWAIEAGALVIANRGFCCIDEFEKMNPKERDRIHEAMAQQTVSLEKTGAHCTFPAKTTVLAAGNPAFGRYDFERTVAENVTLPPAILSRFDLIFIGKGDKPDDKIDEAIASYILGEPSSFKPVIEKDMFRKYIALAKKIKPEMTKEGIIHLKDFYKRMRSLNQGGKIGDSPIVITARQLEGLRRLSEAHARIRLSSKIEKVDAEAATSIMMESLKQVGIDPETGKFDIDAMFGRPKTVRDRMSAILNILSDRQPHSMDEIVEKMDERDVTREETLKIINRLLSEGTIFNPHVGYYQRTR